MKNLIKLNKETITSLELLEQINFFRKQEDKNDLEHYDFLKMIRYEFEEEINEGKISAVEYKDKKGELRPMFNLTTSQAKQVLIRESKLVRKAVIKYLEQLEKNILPFLQEELKAKNRIIDSLRKNMIGNTNIKIGRIYGHYKGGHSNLLHIPAAWKKEMSISDNDNYVKMKFDQVKKIITIEKV